METLPSPLRTPTQQIYVGSAGGILRLGTNILDIFLAVQDKTKQCTKQLFDLFTRQFLNNSLLNVLWTIVGERFGEGIVEARAEHDDELRARSISNMIKREDGILSD